MDLSFVFVLARKKLIKPEILRKVGVFKHADKTKIFVFHEAAHIFFLWDETNSLRTNYILMDL